MGQFFDKKGERWEVAVDVFAIERVSSETGKDLLTLAEPQSELFTECTRKPHVLFAVIIAIIRPQLEARGLTWELFGTERFKGSAPRDALKAVMEGVFDFFPDRQRGVLLDSFQKVLDVQERVETRALVSLEKALAAPNLMESMEAALLKELGGSPGGTPASSASIRGRSRSAKSR